MKRLFWLLVFSVGVMTVQAEVAPIRLPPTRPEAVHRVQTATPVPAKSPAKARAKKHAKKKHRARGHQHRTR